MVLDECDMRVKLWDLSVCYSQYCDFLYLCPNIKREWIRVKSRNSYKTCLSALQYQLNIDLTLFRKLEAFILLGIELANNP